MQTGVNPAFLRVHGWADHAHSMTFIYVARQLTGMPPADAKIHLDRLRAGEIIELRTSDAPTARKLGQELLRLHVVERVELVPAVGGPAEPLAPPPSPPALLCPACGTTLRSSTECPACDYLRFPGDRARWQTQGPCPRCRFAYRWDGARCSHCGHGATERPPVVRP